jgi:hypothetical protein
LIYFRVFKGKKVLKARSEVPDTKSSTNFRSDMVVVVVAAVVVGVVVYICQSHPRHIQSVSPI